MVSICQYVDGCWSPSMSEKVRLMRCLYGYKLSDSFWVLWDAVLIIKAQSPPKYIARDDLNNDPFSLCELWPSLFWYIIWAHWNFTMSRLSEHSAMAWKSPVHSFFWHNVIIWSFSSLLVNSGHFLLTCTISSAVLLVELVVTKHDDVLLFFCGHYSSNRLSSAQVTKHGHSIVSCSYL